MGLPHATTHGLRERMPNLVKKVNSLRQILVDEHHVPDVEHAE